MEKPGNKIAISGVVIIALSLLFFSFAQYRPNRVLSGTHLSAEELFGSGLVMLLFICGFILVFAIGNNKQYQWLIGCFSLLAVGLLLYLLGTALEKDLFTQMPTGRVSLGGGFYLFFLGIYMVITSSFKGYKKGVLYKRLFYLALFLIISIFLFSGHLNELSVMKEFFNRSSSFFQQIRRHFSLSFFSVLIAVLAGIPIGVLIHKSKRRNNPILFLINLGQTIPTLSLLGLIMVPLTFLGEQSRWLRDIGIRGVGFTPAFIILFVYALFPIIHNTMAGLNMVDRSLLETASAMGMKANQSFWKVQFPLSLPVVLGGIRTAMTQSIGNTILAGLIGGGGLGSIIFLGLAQASPDLILLGVIPLVGLAFLLDSILSFFSLYYTRKFWG